MTNLTDEIEALLESEEKVVRSREAAEDARKREQGARGYFDDRYRAEREENDKRRSRKSGDADVVFRDASDEGSTNGSEWHRRAHGSDRNPRSRGVPRGYYREDEEMISAEAEPMAIDDYNQQVEDIREGRSTSPAPIKVKREPYSPASKSKREPHSPPFKTKTERSSPQPYVKTEGSSRRPERDDRRDDRDRMSGDYYKGEGRPGRVDEYRPGSSGSGSGSGGSRHRYHCGRRGDRGRTRSPPRRGDRDPRERRRTPPPRGGRDSRRRGAPPPEPTDDERDRRTVFVQQLANRVRTRDLNQFFAAAGKVVEAQIVKDRVSNRSKGVGYVEFEDEESVEKAIALTGQKLCGIPIIAQLTEAEKNRQARTTEGSATQSNGVPFHRLYVGNIHFSINEDDLKNVFEPFGELEFVQLQKEEHTGRSKGYGFVQYLDPAQAKEALDKMNGFELAGRAIRVGLGNDKFTNESTQHILRSQAPQFNGSSFSGAGGRGAHAGGTGNFDRAGGRDAEKAGGASALDDTDVGGVNFSNVNRDSLMRKLARTEDPEPKAKTTQQKVTVTETPKTRCVRMKHMFNAASETEPGWQKELKEDVEGECNEKYGKVVHVGLALDSEEGEIYVKFDRVQGGENAIKGLNGRYFGGRMIAADYVIEAVYDANFPRARNL